MKRTDYWRTRARVNARKKWLAQNQGATTCQHKFGNGRCGGRLEDRVDRLGRVTFTCPRCERRKAGVCLDCPRKVKGVAGRATRCPECTRERERRTNAARYARNAEHRRTQVKLAMR